MSGILRQPEGPSPKSPAGAASRPFSFSSALPDEITPTRGQLVLRLLPENLSRRQPHDAEAELYSVYRQLQDKTRADSDMSYFLISNLHTSGPDGATEDLRRAVIVKLLEHAFEPDDRDNPIHKLIRAAIAREHLRSPVRYTFALNTTPANISPRATISLSEHTCAFLRSVEETNRMAYARLEHFFSKLPAEELALFDQATAQHIDHGNKRLVFRVKYKDENAALLITLNPSATHMLGRRHVLEEERRLYYVVRLLNPATVKVPDILALVGPDDDCGLVMTDCAKGGNARLVGITDSRQVPATLRVGYQADMLAINEALKATHVVYYLFHSCTYLQISRKNGEISVVLLDMENTIPDANRILQV